MHVPRGASLRLRRWAVVLWLVATAAALSCARETRPQLVLVTTTSVANAGLLEQLLPRYEREHGVRFGVHAVGSGRALQMLAVGDGDVAISHAPEAETTALRQHPQWWYRKIMFNDFLLVGPPDDPAQVRAAGSLDEALRRIAASTVGFVSRADQSGTHERERALWAGVGTQPTHVLPTGQGMAVTLRIAAERGAYTLTDRGTWNHRPKALPLAVVNEGDPRLLNTYAVIVGTTDLRDAALAFARWLADGEGRQAIAAVPGFRLWPVELPRTDPAALPLPRR